MMMDCMVRVHYSFILKTPNCLSKQLSHFAFPSIMNESFCCSISQTVLGVVKCSRFWSSQQVVWLLSYVRLLQPHGLQPTRLLCPLDFPGKNTGVGCHFLLQRIFWTQNSNPGLLHCRWVLYRLSQERSPNRYIAVSNYCFNLDFPHDI